MQAIDDRPGFVLAQLPSMFGEQLSPFALHLVQLADVLEGLLGQLALVGDMQIEELAAGVGHATDFGDALLETGLVASEVVADQLALPVAQEAAHVLTGPARPEVIDHGLEVGEGLGA